MARGRAVARETRKAMDANSSDRQEDAVAPRSRSAPRSRAGRAGRLISQIVAHAGRRDRLASALAIPVEDLEAYETGREPMPLNRQARLALHVIANIPALATEG